MDWLWWAQIAADLVLLGGVALLLLRLKSVGELPSGISAQDLETFLEEANRLGRDFDKLLNEKRTLVGTTLKALEEQAGRLRELQIQVGQAGKDLQEALEQAKVARESLIIRPRPETATQMAASPPGPAVSRMADFRGQVAELSRQGLSLVEISEVTGRPRGEVELVLGLNAQKEQGAG